MAALTDLLKLTHAGITTDEFAAVCRSWLASSRHPRFGRPYPATVYQPMLELLSLLDRNGFSCWIFSGGGTDFMRTWAADVYGLPPHRVIGSVGETEFRDGADGPELVKTAAIQTINDGPQKPSSIHRHVGQRPILAAGNTDGDLAMLQWTAASPHRTLELFVHHTDADREYAYERDPILGSGTEQIHAAATEAQLDRDRYGRRLVRCAPVGLLTAGRLTVGWAQARRSGRPGRGRRAGRSSARSTRRSSGPSRPGRTAGCCSADGRSR